MRILLITGMPGAGKEELLEVARSMDIPFLRMGDIVREFHETSGNAAKGMTVGQTASVERDLRGVDIWAIRALERMYGDLFLVDGCRSMDEVQSFRGLSEDVHIIAVHAPAEQRFSRLVKRARSDAPDNLTEFDNRDNLEMSWGLSEIIALADIMIVNDSDLETFRQRVRETLEGLL